MMVMPANNAKMLVGYLAGRFPGRVGWIMSPDGWREPHDWLPYHLDNWAFVCYTKQIPWDEAAFYAHCRRTVGHTHKPRWIAVPDVVANREETLRMWFLHSPRVSKFGCPLAFVAQDGMTPDDIPPNADVVFIGGSDDWKMRNLKDWTSAFPRVHVGRINGEKGLWECHEAGAESCDGSGWFRGCKTQLAGLLRYLEDSTHGKPQSEFAL